MLRPNDPVGGLLVGERAPAFSAVDNEGREVRLNDHRGMQRIVAFVSPSCSACAETVEALNDAAESTPQLAILAVGGLDREANRSYAAKHSARMPILTPKVDIGRQMYRVRGVPYVYVLDEKGIIRAAGVVNGKEHLHNLLESSRPSTLATAQAV